MTFDTGLIFFISMLLMWIKPGPAQLLKIAITLDKGIVSGLAFSLGSMTMCSGFFVMAALGYKALSEIFSYTGFFLQILGAAYLIYLSVRGFVRFFNGRTNRKKPELSDEIKNNSSFLPHYFSGILITSSNPFWIFYFIGILPSLISLGEISVNSYLLGAFLVFLSGVLVDGPMLLLVKELQKAFAGGNIAKYVNLFINFCFLGIAAFLIYSAFFVGEFFFDINDVLNF